MLWNEIKDEREGKHIKWLAKKLVAKRGKPSEYGYTNVLLKKPHLSTEVTAILQDYFNNVTPKRARRSQLLLADKIGSDRFEEYVNNLALKPWKHPLRVWRFKPQWAALMIKSRRGDDAAAAKLVEVFRNQPDIKERLRGLSDIGWTRHSQAWNALAELVMSDERLSTKKGTPGTPVCWIAIRAMEIYVPGFRNGKQKPSIPPPSDLLTIGSHGPFSFTKEEIELCREWVRQQPWY